MINVAEAVQGSTIHLSHSDLPAGGQKVVNVPSALCSCQLGLNIKEYYMGVGEQERLTTAGEGTCMEDTALGDTWLAM